MINWIMISCFLRCHLTCLENGQLYFKRKGNNDLSDSVCIYNFTICSFVSLVCRRWQVLVHMHFSKMTALEISERFLEIAPPFTRPIISKLLVLSGRNLKSLKVERIDFATGENILRIISKSSPENVK